MKNKSALAILSLAVAMTLGLPVVSHAQATAPTQPAKVEKLTATITGVQGLVQVRDGDGKPWQKATVGMVLGEDAEFRTGPKSAVQFTLPPDQTVTLDRLGTVKLVQAIKSNGKIITNLGMKYGRTRYDIEAAGQEHESTISSPSSTLAVRGTKVSLYDQPPFKPEAVSLTGRASFRDGKKQLAFGGKGSGKAKINSGESSAAGTALTIAVLDPTLSLARTGGELPVVSSLISRGATIEFDRTTGMKVLRGGVPPTDQQLIPTLPGQLNFVLRWNSDADLNLSIGSPGGKNNAGEFLYPVLGLNTNRSGGRIDFDHRGGPNGGIEIAYWKGSAPEGLYGMGVAVNRGGATAATMDVFRGGQKVEFFDGQNNVTTSNFTALPPIPGIGEGTAIGVFGLNTSVPGAPSGGVPPVSGGNGGGTGGEPGAPPVTGGTAGEPGAPPTLNTLAASSTAATAKTVAAKAPTVTAKKRNR